MYMKSYTLLALLAATMISTTEAVNLTSAVDSESLAGIDGIFDLFNQAQDMYTTATAVDEGVDAATEAFNS